MTSNSIKPSVSAGTKKLSEVLTEEEKRANHIASEQKRRMNLRDKYERLIDVVPDLDYSVKGEAVILDKGVLCVDVASC